MNSKFDSTLLALPFVLHLRSPNCFSADVPEEEKGKTVEGIAVRRRKRLVWSVPCVAWVALEGRSRSTRGTESAAANEGTRIKSTLHLETFVLTLADPNQKPYRRVGIDFV